MNGTPIFAKGANVVPFSSFPNRVTPDRYRHFLVAARDTYDFKENVEKEARDQLVRLRNHPSTVLLCGNKETEEAINWRSRNKLDDLTRLHIWGYYLTTFHGILARVVARLEPEIPCWPSSPSADLEQQSATCKSGDDHIWDVWHGRVPFTTYETHRPRFVSEYGFQSLPELRTVDRYTNRGDRISILSPVMLAYQKSPAGNELINIYMLRDYTASEDFPSFLDMSQVLQAEGVKIGAEHFRRERPITMVLLYWQLNDRWPVASRSSMDSPGRGKALQFYAK